MAIENVHRGSSDAADLCDPYGNLCNAAATLLAHATMTDNDAVMALAHLAEFDFQIVKDAVKADATEDEKDEAAVYLSCLAKLIDGYNVSHDIPLLHAASVLVHLACNQLSEVAV